MASINGTTIKPSNIDVEMVVIGEEIEAGNGTITQIRRGNGTKFRWTITWNGVSSATRAQLLTLAQISTTFVFVDDTGASYTALFDMQPFTSSFAFLAGGVPYYNVSLKLQEEA